MQINDPTERSIPPAMITIASPSANSEINAMWRTLLLKLSAPRKYGFKIARPPTSHQAWSALFLRCSCGKPQDVRVRGLRARQLALDFSAGEHERAMTQRL